MISVDAEKCNGCRLCELVCSIKHEKKACPSRSRIEVIETKDSVFVPIHCYQCADAPCVKECSAGALKWIPEKNLVFLDEEACIGCKVCEEACPFGVIGINSENGKAFKCDLCDLKPSCVEICPMNALTFTHPENITYKKKLKTAEKLLIS